MREIKLGVTTPVFPQLFGEGDKFTSAVHFSERALERVSSHTPVSLAEVSKF